MAYYPVNLYIAGRLCVIFGGGSVALRKVNSLIDAGGKVRLISPVVVKELEAMAALEKIEWFARSYVRGDVEGAFLVFAATSNREVQQQISVEAGEKKALFNSADDPAGSLFHVPAHFRRGRILVTVATGGGSPALAKILRQQLEERIVPGYGAVVELLALIRDGVLAGGGDSAVNAGIFRELLARDIVDMTLRSDWFEVQMLLLEVLPQQIDGVALLKDFLEKYDKG
jgi:precorrin-2 dehydrogenase/sirohydrochlorin ferrochelatase